MTNIVNIRTTSKLDGTLLPTDNRLEATELVAGMVVVKATGEIMSSYSTNELDNASHGEATYHRLTNVLPQDFTSVHQMDAWLDAVADRRKLIHKNDVKDAHDQSAGLALRTGGTPMFTVPEFRKLDAIVKALSYRNILIGTTEGVAQALGVDITNLQRDLKGLSGRGIVKVWNARSGMAKGMVKIMVNPVLGWKHESTHFEASRATAIQAWYAQESIDLVGSHLKPAEVIVEKITPKPAPTKVHVEDDLFPDELVSVYVNTADTVNTADCVVDKCYTDVDSDNQTLYTPSFKKQTQPGEVRA